MWNERKIYISYYIGCDTLALGGWGTYTIADILRVLAEIFRLLGRKGEVYTIGISSEIGEFKKEFNQQNFKKIMAEIKGLFSI